MKRTLIALILVWPSVALATGWHHVPVVKPHVVAPVVAAPPAVAPAATTPAAAPAASPAPQPASGKGPGATSYAVFLFVIAFFAETVYTHWAWCEEDDQRSPNARMCYRPLRDGMP
jgi:hypothetical protein